MGYQGALISADADPTTFRHHAVATMSPVSHGNVSDSAGSCCACHPGDHLVGSARGSRCYRPAHRDSYGKPSSWHCDALCLHMH
jgi:hypothetical protein